MARIFRIAIWGFLLLHLLPLEADCQKLALKFADKSFEEFAYTKAAELYLEAYKKDSSDNYIVKQLAESNRFIGNTIETELWLNKLVQRNAASPEDLFNYYQVLKSNGKYEKAEFWLNKYATLKPDDIRVSIHLSELEYIPFLMKDSINYEIRNVSLNTPGSEIGPAFYKKQLVFSSTSIGSKLEVKYNWNDLPFLSLYSATIQPNGDLPGTQSFAPKLKTSYHDGPVSFDTQHHIIYITRNNFVRGKVETSKDKVVNLKIFEGKLVKDEWKLSRGFKYNSDEYSVGHPSINKDGSILYFASDMPGGYGKSDIYFSVNTNGEWGKPQNLGPMVNTADNEFFPFLGGDNVLYFASDGHGGLGGLDIFFSYPQNGTFTKIQNMGYPLNSPADDFGLALDSTGTKGYFASNRAGGKGYDDIYALHIRHIQVIIKGIIRDMETDELLSDAFVSLIDENENTISTGITRSNGEYRFNVEKGQTYQVKVSKENYKNNAVSILTSDLRATEERQADIILEPETVAQEMQVPKSMENIGGETWQVIDLEYINYALDQVNITPDNAGILDRLIDIMIDNPDMQMRVESHTDSRGSADYNMKLSATRAKLAADYLSSKGNDP